MPSVSEQITTAKDELAALKDDAKALLSALDQAQGDRGNADRLAALISRLAAVETGLGKASFQATQDERLVFEAKRIADGVRRTRELRLAGKPR